VNRRISNDVPTRQNRSRVVTIRARLAEQSYLVTDVAGTAQPAWNPGTGSYTRGEHVNAEWNNAAGQWVLEPRDAGTGTADSCRFQIARRVGIFDPTDLTVSPDGQWLADVDTDGVGGYYLEIMDTDGNYTTFQTLPGQQTGLLERSIVFSPDGNWIAAVLELAPFLIVYPFDTATGTIGAAVAAPGTLPVARGSTVAWAPGSDYLFMDQAGNVPIVGYAWSGGFGARLTNPTFPVYLPTGGGATVPTSAEGIAIRPQGDFIVVCTNSDYNHRVLGWTFAAGVYGSLVEATLDATGQPYPASPLFNEAGTLIAFTSDGDSFGTGTFDDGSADAWAMPVHRHVVWCARRCAGARGRRQRHGDPAEATAASTAAGCRVTEPLLVPNETYVDDGRDEPCAHPLGDGHRRSRTLATSA
jgi:hypothetical protein